MRSPNAIVHDAFVTAATAAAPCPYSRATARASTRISRIGDSAVIEMQYAIRARRQRIAVRYDQRRSAVGAALIEQFEYRALGLGVDFSGRLVGKQHGGLGRGRRGKRSAARRAS